MNDFQRNRLRNVILYILKDFSGGTDYIKLYKIMYFANKKQLAETGLPLVYDNFKAWKYGPVPSFTGATLKCLETNETPGRDMKPFYKSLKVRKNKRVVALDSPDLTTIPEYSRQIIDSLIPKYKNRSWKDISEESHDGAWFEAYHRFGVVSDVNRTIRPHLVAAAADASDFMIDMVKLFFTKRTDSYNFCSDSKSLAAYEKAVLELHSLLKLEADWDGEGAYAISRDAARQCRNLLSHKQSRVELISEIYPTPTGNVCIDWNVKGNIVSAEIGGRQIGFYCEAKDENNSYDSPVLEVGQGAFVQLYDRIEQFDTCE